MAHAVGPWQGLLRLICSYMVPATQPVSLARKCTRERSLLQVAQDAGSGGVGAKGTGRRCVHLLPAVTYVAPFGLIQKRTWLGIRREYY